LLNAHPRRAPPSTHADRAGPAFGHSLDRRSLLQRPAGDQEPLSVDPLAMGYGLLASGAVARAARASSALGTRGHARFTANPFQCCLRVSISTGMHACPCLRLPGAAPRHVSDIPTRHPTLQPRGTGTSATTTPAGSPCQSRWWWRPCTPPQRARCWLTQRQPWQLRSHPRRPATTRPLPLPPSLWPPPRRPAAGAPTACATSPPRASRSG
jgi:hypothetical protein